MMLKAYGLGWEASQNPTFCVKSTFGQEIKYVQHTESLILSSVSPTVSGLDKSAIDQICRIGLRS